MTTKPKKNPKYMDECFANEPCYEIPKKKHKRRVIVNEDFDIGV